MLRLSALLSTTKENDHVSYHRSFGLAGYHRSGGVFRAAPSRRYRVAQYDHGVSWARIRDHAGVARHAVLWRGHRRPANRNAAVTELTLLGYQNTGAAFLAKRRHAALFD